MTRIFEQLARVRTLLRPPAVTAVSRWPVGYLAVERDRVRRVLAWAQTDRGIVGLVASWRGLRPARGGRYLPGGLHDATEVPVPITAIPVGDLEEAIGKGDVWSPVAQSEIFQRLRDAASVEWAGRALAAYVADPTAFLKRHFEMIAEHGRAADVDDNLRTFLASLTATPEPQRARSGEGDRP